MSTDKSNPFIRKKYTYDLDKDPSHHDRLSTFQTPIKYNTIDSNLSHNNFSIQSSRIADETEQLTHKTINYEDALRQKLEYFEAETEKLIEKKEREIYFLSVEMKNYEMRWKEAEEISECQREEISRLRDQLERLQGSTQNSQYYEAKINGLVQQNAKLKAGIDSLKDQNDRHRLPTPDYLPHPPHNYHSLKREVQDLKQVIAEMQYSIRNCSSCFSLRRQNQQLSQAYTNLQKMYHELNQHKKQHQKTLLQNITAKIQQNQNIARENLQLREKSNPRALKSTRQKLKESVAKRCRTLTDQF